MLLILMIIGVSRMTTDMSEAHVYCQDDQATAWTPLGYSCPVNCASVISAVKRLKQMDYENLFNLHELENANRSLASVNDSIDNNDLTSYRRNDIQGGPSTKEFNGEHFFQLDKILHNPKAVGDLQRIFNNAPSLKNGACPVMLHKLLRYNKYEFSKGIKGFDNFKSHSARRCDFEKDFLKIFTVTLNKYTTNEHTFDEELTQIILQKILGTDIDLRHGLFDVEKLLNYLKEAISIHEKHSKGRSSQSSTINLRSKYCLSMYVPGCFCKSGYVESRGQCVRPTDCFENPYTVLDYLTKIIVH